MNETSPNSFRAMLVAVVLCGLAPLGNMEARAQQKAQTLKSALTGTTWTLTSAEVTDAKGVKSPLVAGGDTKGQLILDQNGRYSFQVIGAIPKFAGERLNSTPEESKAVARGLLTHFGSYSIDEAEQTLVLNVERSSYPNLIGVPGKRKITLKGNEMVMDNPARLAGGQTKVVWRKEK
jgi:Lipocalin-like domain